MIVYHGTTLEIQKPEIIENEIGRDFGFAFIQRTSKNKRFVGRFAVRRY